ncbi:MAG: hypothetical protein IEMM0003_0842 [bacterium]|nr:MAG: hypothetical protein IEMM0003_0842 [bacterium]
MKKTVEKVIEILSAYKPELQKQYKIKRIGIFGSYVKNEENEESDVDILIEYYELPDLIEFIELKNHLSDLLDMKVDLVMKRALKPHIGNRILQEVVNL